MKKVLFVDFDGTITKVDTCFAMIQTFARDGWQELDQQWQDKKISTAECADLLFRLFDATIEDIKKFLDGIDIDEYFPEFLALCRGKGYDVYILSDGYDVNIETIMKKHDITVEYYANRMVYEPDKGFGIKCPHENAACKKCGTCKTGLIKKLSTGSDQVIYIGDGCSDMCAAGNADVVFAKGVLYRYCLEKGIKAVHFDDFRDIITSGLI